MTATVLPVRPRPELPLLVPDARFIVAELHAMKLDGVLRHLVGDAFLPTCVVETPELRAAALALQIPANLARRTIVGQLSAAWVYGCAPPPHPMALFLASGGKSALLPPFSGCSLRQVRLGTGAVWDLAGTCVTSPLRTAVDVARTAPLPLVFDVLSTMAAQKHLHCSLNSVLAALLAAPHVPGRLRGAELLRRMGAAG